MSAHSKHTFRYSDSIHEDVEACRLSSNISHYATHSVVTKAFMREAREVRYRKNASRLYGFGVLNPPKGYREAYILRRRDKRNPILLHDGDFEEQGFNVLAKRLTVGALAAVGGLFARKISKLLTGSTELVGTLKTYVDMLGGFVAQIKASLGHAIWLIPLLIVVRYFLHYIPKEVVSLLISALAIVVGAKVWKHFSQYFTVDQKVDSRPEPKIVGANEGRYVGLRFEAGLAFPCIGKLLAAAFAFSVFKGRNQERNVTEFQKRVTLFDKFADSWDGLAEWVLGCLDKLIAFAHERFGTPRVTWFQKEKGPLLVWAGKVDALCCRSIETARVKPEELKEMIGLLREGYLFQEKFYNTRTHRFVAEYVAKIIAYMMPFQGAINARNNFRFEPVALVLYGKPGVGKTIMINYLSMAILMESGLVPADADYQDLLCEIWQKGSSQYWNGYAEQKVLAIDDVFQKRANPSDEESDYLNFIKLVSSFSCPLNFADLSSKGKIYFLSYLIIATTNLISLNEQAEKVIVEPGAVVRRITFPLTVTVHPDFALENGRLNYQLFRAAHMSCKTQRQVIDRFPWHVWEVCTHDFGGNEIDGPKVSMKDKILEIVNLFRARLEQHATVEQDLKDFVHGVEPEPVPEPINLNFEAGEQPYDQCAAPFLAAVDGLFDGPDLDRPPAFLSPVQRAAVCVNALRDAFLDDTAELERDFTMWKYFCKVVKWAGISAGIAIAAKAIINALVGGMRSLFNIVTGRRNHSRKKNKQKVDLQSQSNRVEKPKQITVRDVQMQAFNEPIPRSIRDNTYTLTVNTPGSFIHVGTVTFLLDNLAVQPTHFTTEMQAHIDSGKITRESTITLAHNEAGSFDVDSPGNRVSNYKTNFSVGYYMDLRRHVVKDRELEFLCFKSMRSHCNIKSYYIRAVDVKSVGGNSGLICIYRPVTPTTFMRVFQPTPTLKFERSVDVKGKTINNTFAYHCVSSLGDCGSPVLMSNVPFFGPRQGVGIHVAGSRTESVGVCAILTQDDIESAMTALNTIRDDFVPDLAARDLSLTSGFDLPYFGGSMLPIGVVKEKANLTSKSKFFKTCLYGKWGDYGYHPAHMKPVRVGDEKIYPMVKAVEPYTTPVQVYEHDFMEQAMYLTVGRFNSLTVGCSRRVYTFEEAVKGVPEEKFRAIPRATSAGYPLCLYTAKGKKDFFGTDIDYDLGSDACLELEQRVEHILSEASKGVRLAHIYMDFLKDELRSVAKNEKVATRLISCAPLDYTIAWRRMFGAYSAAMFRHNTRSGMAPGICTFSDWPTLAMLLRSKGRHCFDGDFKGFDSSEQPTIHMLMLDVINKWYDDGPVNARIREVLWLDLVHSRHITGLGNNQCYIVQWNKSLPSGHPFTTIVNSLYSLFLLICAYIHVTGDRLGFWTNVFAVTYGDDNVSNMADHIVDVFNQSTVSAALWDLFGMVYTSANKTAELGTSFSLEDMSFLKRGFYFDHGNTLCPLELDSFLYTPYWCKNRRLERDIIVDTLENALEELSLHPPEFWERYAAPIVHELLVRSSEDVPLPRAIPTRSSYQKLVLSRVDNWY